MKKLTLFIFIFILLCASFSSAATLKWDAPTSGQIEGYNIYFTDGIDNFNQNVGNVLEVIDIDSAFNLIPGKTYIFTCTAWNIYGESGLSNEVVYGTPAIYTPPPTVIPIHVDKPTTITIDIIVN